MTGEQRIDLDRRRTVGGILVATAELYRCYPLLFTALALAVMAPYELLVLAITGYGPLKHSHENAGATWLLLLLRTSLITPLISALLTHAVVVIGEGRRPQLRTVALSGLRVLPVVAAAEIMANIGIALGFIALIVPGIVLSLRWAVVAQAAALEDDGWIAALGSSGRLTAKHYWHVFGLLLVTGLLSGGVLLGVAAIPLGGTSGAASVAVGIAVQTLIAAYAALTLALLYFELRAWSRTAPEMVHEQPQPPGRS
jgi:hypothetical protein